MISRKSAAVFGIGGARGMVLWLPVSLLMWAVILAALWVVVKL